MEKQIAVVEQRIVQIREAWLTERLAHADGIVQGDGGRVRLLCEQAKRLEEGPSGLECNGTGCNPIGLILQLLLKRKAHIFVATFFTGRRATQQ